MAVVAVVKQWKDFLMQWVGYRSKQTNNTYIAGLRATTHLFTHSTNIEHRNVPGTLLGAEGSSILTPLSLGKLALPTGASLVVPLALPTPLHSVITNLSSNKPTIYANSFRPGL